MAVRRVLVAMPLRSLNSVVGSSERVITRAWMQPRNKGLVQPAASQIHAVGHLLNSAQGSGGACGQPRMGLRRSTTYSMPSASHSRRLAGVLPSSLTIKKSAHFPQFRFEVQVAGTARDDRSLHAGDIRQHETAFFFAVDGRAAFEAEDGLV
jgi:hypothetical protein